MHILYNIGVLLYGLAIQLAAFVNPKAKEWVNGRRNYFKNLPIIDTSNLYWFHCASLGEFDQALPVINLLKEKDPSIFIFVTFFSPSGYLHYQKRKHKVDLATYLPLDTPGNAKLFIQHFKPKKAFFVKYEFWANYIFEAKKQNVKLYSISALFREKQHFFKPNAKFFPSVLKQFDYFFVQNQLSANLLEKIGINKYLISGDTRFDRVIENKSQLQPNLKIESFLNGEKAFIIGSSWPEDESILIPLLNSNKLSNKIIIAPHSVDENHIQQIIKELKVPFIRYTQMKEKSTIESKPNVLILDTIGQLSSAYFYGEIAYVGGGFSGSLHNILEPAVFGLPVLFGPKFTKYPEASEFLNHKIGFSINSTETFLINYQNITSNLSELNASCQLFINSNKGASEKIISTIEKQN